MKALRLEKKHLLIGIPVLIALLIGGYVVFLKYQDTQKLLDNPAAASQADVQRTIDRVGKLILLPAHETPTVATVSDISKLKNQPFFTNAQNGDRVLIYQESKKAILYRPADNKIIEVAPVNVGPTDASSSAQQASPTPAEIRFLLLNGTSVTGLTQKFEPTLKERVPNSVVVDRDNAAASNYPTSLIIDVAGDKAAQAKTLATALGLTVSQMPEGEKAPTGADFVIILGQDVAGASGTLKETPVPTISQ